MISMPTPQNTVQQVERMMHPFVRAVPAPPSRSAAGVLASAQCKVP